MKSLKFIVVSLLATSLFSCKKDVVLIAKTAPSTHLKLTFKSILNTPVTNPLSVAEWNAFFATSVNATTSFTSVSILGNEISLNGAENLVVSSSTFYRNNQLLSVDDDSTIIGVAEYAFSNASELLTVSMGNAKYLGESSFKGNAKTTYVNMPRLLKIGNAAFDNNLKLVNVNAENVTEIGEGGFGNCIVFANAIFPKATKVGDASFAYCGLTNVDLRSCINLGTTTNIDDFVFYNIANKNITIKLPINTSTDFDIVSLQNDNAVTITH